jgi:hypothetical protein
LSLHQHLDCIVLGGGVNKDGQWQISEEMASFCCKSLIESFRAKYCEKLKAIVPIQYEQIRQELWSKPWFCQNLEVQSEVEYLGRYTHKIASNHRIQCRIQNVTFGYKDYRKAGVKNKMTLTHQSLSDGFRCIFCPTGFENPVLWVLNST